MNDIGKIRIRAHSAALSIIDIEGIIGLPEELQFDAEDERVATYEKFRASAMRIAELQSQRVRVNIRSQGGSVAHALLIYEALSALKCTVESHCYGYTASAATIIAQAASPGERYVSANALYLIHLSHSQIEGNVGQVSEMAGLLEQTDNRIAQIYAQHSSASEQQMLELMSENHGAGRWLSPQQTVELGLADQIESQSLASKLGQKLQNVATLLGIDSTDYIQQPEPLLEQKVTMLEQRVEQMESHRVSLETMQERLACL
ncbi:MAG: Clp protease ClpP, partial [Mucinivorans sp.]